MDTEFILVDMLKRLGVICLPDYKNDTLAIYSVFYKPQFHSGQLIKSNIKLHFVDRQFYEFERLYWVD